MNGDIDTISTIEEPKSADKKEIEIEERERMLNAENKSADEVQKPDSDMKEIIKPSDPVTEEGREVKPKFIPIGGIKMPGFFTRSKSKEKCKDLDDGAQGELLEKPSEDTPANKEGDEKDATPKKSILQSLKIPNIFSKTRSTPAADDTKDPEESNTSGTTGQKKGLLNAIRLPLANMIPQRLRMRSGGADPESGLDNAKTAELASMETLDDNKDTEKPDIKSDDGMETVKLDIEDKTDGDDSNKEKLTWRERIRQQKFIIDDLAIAGGVVLFIILLIIIIAITAIGGKPIPAISPLKDGQYVDAVTSCGYVEGILEDGAIAFRGIPYARPPIGNNRWRSASPLDKIESCWNGTLKAHNATPACIQDYGNGTIDGIEDCLTLDVITPEVRYDNPLPVIVMIGSNTLIGGAPGKLRPSTRYARSKDVVFVRPNFRVGVTGFLSLESLSQSSYPHISGNYGFSDIITALKWVKLNIKNFGGDPKAVTIFGHRAGATLVTALITSKEAKDLFARAWVSSGSSSFPDKAIEKSKEENNLFNDLLKCSDVECLRNSNINAVINAVPDTWRSVSSDLPLPNSPNNTHEWLVVDTKIISGNVYTALSETKIPLIVGTTAHESASKKLFLKHAKWTPELVTKHIDNSIIGQLKLTEEAVKRYNATYQGLAAMISDIRTVCPLILLAKQNPEIPFYIVTQGQGENNIADVDSDITAILGRYEPKTPEQRRYVAAMQQLFYHYVWHGQVPQATKKNSILQVGQDVLSIENYPNCDFWIENKVVPGYAKQD